MLHSHISELAFDFFEWMMDSPEHFATVTDVTVGGVLHLAADARRAFQRETFSWGVDYFQWLVQTDMWNIDNSPQNIPLIAMMSVSMAVAFMPAAIVTMAPYFSPYTAPAAFALDAYNIYRHFD